MQPKSGFLLIEIMIGLSVSVFFILIIAHYIIEVKVTQQKALRRIEVLSCTRNKMEHDIAKKNADTHEL